MVHRIAKSLHDTEALLHIVGLIYDAALDPTGWEDALRQVAAFFNSAGAGLFAQNTMRQDGLVFYSWGTPQSYKESYFKTYAPLDPSRVAQFFMDVGQPYSTADMLPLDEFYESRFYLEWAKPQGLKDHLAVTLQKSVSRISAFGSFRHKVVSADDMKKFNLVWPHVQRAFNINTILEEKTAKADQLAATFDALTAAIFLLDDKCRVVHANAAGLEIAGRSPIVRMTSGRFVLGDAELNEILQNVLAARDTADKTLLPNSSAKIFAGTEGEEFAIHILPLTNGARQKAGSVTKAAAAVFIQRKPESLKSPAEMIARAFKLTPSELRILLGIVEVGGVPQVALALGIAESTVKTHLLRVYAKTGTNRQVDLAKLLASYSGLLNGP